MHAFWSRPLVPVIVREAERVQELAEGVGAGVVEALEGVLHLPTILPLVVEVLTSLLHILVVSQLEADDVLSDAVQDLKVSIA